MPSSSHWLYRPWRLCTPMASDSESAAFVCSISRRGGLAAEQNKLPHVDIHAPHLSPRHHTSCIHCCKEGVWVRLPWFCPARQES